MTGPTIVFGGPYSNLQATQAVLAHARRLGIPPDRIVCTGDLAAYCGEPVATIELVRDAGIHVVMGNCDEQLANNADACGCGLPAGGLCERLSSVWFTYANSQVSTDIRRWLAQLPRRIDLNIGARRLAVIHGGVREINRFVFASTPVTKKRQEIDAVDADGIVAGHCGLPFTQIIDGRLWHNAGVVGMPANDGTPRVWYSRLTPDVDGVRIEHCALEYDHAAAAAAMRRAGLPADYRDALANGLWPSCDVLPTRETDQQGLRLTPGSLLWAKPSRRRVRAKQRGAGRWPSLSVTRRTAAPAIGSTAVACCAALTEKAATEKPANACCRPSYIDAARDLYRDAALAPAANLCCTTNPIWQLPEMNVPDKMLAMNYGCGTTVHPRDLGGSPSIVYVGVGGGLELLQFAYFSRRRSGVIGLDVVDEMLSACSKNLDLAEEINPWFQRSFVDLRKGDAFDLPLEDGVTDVAAQNCLFNIFKATTSGARSRKCIACSSRKAD